MGFVVSTGRAGIIINPIITVENIQERFLSKVKIHITPLSCILHRGTGEGNALCSFLLDFLKSCFPCPMQMNEESGLQLGQ